MTQTAGIRKRIKLGYHRTSIACSKVDLFLMDAAHGLLGGRMVFQARWNFARVTTNQSVRTTGHCRHRKIRCIVSLELPNRCISCIRLKKDCSFGLVDQQPPADSQGNTAGQGSGSSTAHSQSSSPALAPGNPTGMAARSVYVTGPVQDSVALAPPVVMPSNIGYASVAGENLLDARVLETYTDHIL